jgi:hypothetical protein
MSINKLMRASLIGVVSLSALMVQAATVPAEWNVDPWTNGVSFEDFQSVPSWATGAGQQALAGAPNRSDRFWTNTVSAGNQLVFSTLGITNTISGAKIQPGTPVFVDLRCKIYSFGSTPPTIAPNTLLCFYANQNSNLVVASSTECKTNTAITILPSEYYSVMIRFATDAFDVFFTNSATPVLSLTATTNQIARMQIAGDGQMDDLYMSYGDPTRTVYTNAITFSSWTPTSAEEKVVSNWVATQKAKQGASVTAITKDNAVSYYLTDSQPSDSNFAGELGIGSIAYNPNSTSVTVVVTLKTDASTKKTGKINGLLKLKGAQTYNDAKSGTWSSVLATTTIQSQDFANGVATYTFVLPNADNKFFLPVIQSNIQ